jgi:hypothetical protein
LRKWAVLAALGVLAPACSTQSVTLNMATRLTCSVDLGTQHKQFDIQLVDNAAVSTALGAFAARFTIVPEKSQPRLLRVDLTGPGVTGSDHGGGVIGIETGESYNGGFQTPAGQLHYSCLSA